MTQLFIAGVETVLPQEFSVTVKRENSFFTKSGEYTYDCTLRLDNPVNCQLYGFLNRTNKSDQLDTDRTAMLIADGHVYCRGKEVITRWTEDSVTIQIVSGESELNYFIGQDKKIEDLDLGEIEDANISASGGTYPTHDYCLATVRNTNGEILNIPGNVGGRRTGDRMYSSDTRPMPYLCALLRRLLEALGYNEGREMVNQLEETQFKNLFLVNTVYTWEYAKMLPGWTVKDFMTEVERLTGIVFITDNVAKTCDILLKQTYYYEARQLPLSNVVDAYETELEDDDSREAEFTASDVSYDLPDHHWAKVMKLPDDFLAQAEIVDYPNISALVNSPFNPQVVKRDTSDGRCYINVSREWTSRNQDEPETDAFTIEANQFCNLDRVDNESTLELKITPAPMAQLGRYVMEVIDLGDADGYMDYNSSTDEEGDDSESNAGSVEDMIRKFEKTETSATDLYCAFYNGLTWRAAGGSGRGIVVYTDAYHATIQGLLFPAEERPRYPNLAFDGLEGSLRLKDLDADYYQGGYEIDTRHAVTFETFDPNVIDPRQVYVIRNRRYVVRDVEETITAEGRQKLWKVTCYPITISDEAIEKRWILTKGVWDDGAAWLDDGRWNDNPI